MLHGDLTKINQANCFSGKVSQPDRFVLLSEVAKRFCVSPKTIMRRIQERKFPRPVDWSKGKVVFIASVIADFIEDLKKKNNK